MSAKTASDVNVGEVKKSRKFKTVFFESTWRKKLWWFVRPETWKEQEICLQKLQAVVITFLLFNFLEEYIIVKRTLTTLISLRCTRNVRA